MKILAGSSNRPLAVRVASALAVEMVPVEIFVFPDGERRVRVESSLVGEVIAVVQSTANPTDTLFMELLFLADAAKRSGAKSVTAVMPYVGYQRQDHMFRSGEAVSLEVVIAMLEAVGINRLIAFDFHSSKSPAVFHIPVSHLSALPLFATQIRERGWHASDSVLVSPDMGGIRRIKLLSESLDGMGFVTVEKNRDLVTGKVCAVGFAGELAKRAIIVDDMISSGSTVIEAANLLKRQGVAEVIVMATHAVFSEQAPGLLEQSVIAEVLVSDTVSIPQERRFGKLKVLSVGEMIAGELAGEK
jgi:ribose-phosphate pyrophosphokinase